MVQINEYLLPLWPSLLNLKTTYLDSLLSMGIQHKIRVLIFFLEQQKKLILRIILCNNILFLLSRSTMILPRDNLHILVSALRSTPKVHDHPKSEGDLKMQ